MDQYPWPAPFSSDRRQYLESGELFNYNTLTLGELQAEVQARGLTLHDLRRPRKDLHYIKVLKEHDQQDLKNYQTWKRRIEVPLNPTEEEIEARSRELIAILQARQGHMFASTYKEDPSRKTFLDLPGEIRNCIYEYSMFSFDNVIGIRKFRAPYYLQTDFLLVHPRDYPERLFHRISVTALLLLSATNKQIRSEARSLFWSHFRCELSIQEESQMMLLAQKFLNMVGQQGRVSMPSFRLSLLDTYQISSRKSDIVQELLPTLANCVNLQSLDLQLMVSSLFNGEMVSLKSYYLSRTPFPSRSLDLFIEALTALPKLKTLTLRASRCTHTWADAKTGSFRAFALSGIRELKLWTEVLRRLHAANDHGNNEHIHKFRGKVEVTLEMYSAEVTEKSLHHAHRNITNYEKWVRKVSKMVLNDWDSFV